MVLYNQQYRQQYKDNTQQPLRIHMSPLFASLCIFMDGTTFPVYALMPKDVKNKDEVN